MCCRRKGTEQEAIPAMWIGRRLCMKRFYSARNFPRFTLEGIVAEQPFGGCGRIVSDTEVMHRITFRPTAGSPAQRFPDHLKPFAIWPSNATHSPTMALQPPLVNYAPVTTTQPRFCNHPPALAAAPPESGGEFCCLWLPSLDKEGWRGWATGWLMFCAAKTNHTPDACATTRCARVTTPHPRSCNHHRR